MHLRPYGPDTLLLLWEYWHGDWPVGSPPDLTPSFDVEMFPEVCVRGLQTMVPGLGSYLGNIPRSTIVDGGYYTETPELLPLVGPVGGEGLEGAWLCGGLAGYGVMAANVSRGHWDLGCILPKVPAIIVRTGRWRARGAAHRRVRAAVVRGGAAARSVRAAGVCGGDGRDDEGRRWRDLRGRGWILYALAAAKNARI